MGPIEWMARNSIAANLLMILLLGGGLWMAVQVQKEIFPEAQLDVVEVGVTYPGAAPEEVEQGVLMPVEEAVQGVESILAGGQPRAHLTDHVHYVAEALDDHVLRQLDGSEACHPTQVIASQVHEHLVFGPLLGVGPELFLQGAVLIPRERRRYPSHRPRRRPGVRDPRRHAGRPRDLWAGARSQVG